MVVHALFLIIVLICSLLPKKEQRRGILVCGFILFILFAFKGFNVGKDTPSYIYEYITNSYTTEYDSENFEPGRTIFQAVCKLVGLGARGYLIIVSIIICIPLIKIIKRYSIDPCFAFLLYLTIGNYTFNMTGIRQSIAISIIIGGVLIAFKHKYLLRRIFVLFVAVIIASLMHKSSLFCLILIPFLCFWRIPRKLVLLMTAIPLVLLLLKSSVSSFYTLFLVGKYKAYDSFETDPNIIAYFVIPYVIYLYSTYLFLLWDKRHNIDKNSCKDRLVVFCYLASWLYAVIAGASIAFPITTRFIYYVNLFTFILISNLLQIQNKENKRIHKLGIAIVCVLFFLVTTPGGILAIDNYYFSFDK